MKREPWLVDLAEEQPLLTAVERAAIVMVLSTPKGRRRLEQRSARFWREVTS